MRITIRVGPSSQWISAPWATRPSALRTVRPPAHARSHRERISPPVSAGQVMHGAASTSARVTKAAPASSTRWRPGGLDGQEAGPQVDRDDLGGADALGVLHCARFGDAVASR